MKNKAGIVHAVTSVIAVVATLAATFSKMAMEKNHANEIKQINLGGIKPRENSKNISKTINLLENE